VDESKQLFPVGEEERRSLNIEVPDIQDLLDANCIKCTKEEVQQICEELASNTQNLKEASQHLFNNIFSSIGIAPRRLRVVAHLLQQIVVRKFPKSRYSCLGGMLFLRSICPMILSAHKWLNLPVSATARRNLILVSKVLQNVANGITFGSKERYMVSTNSLIQRSLPRMHAFFDEFASPEDPTIYEILLPPTATLQAQAEVLRKEFEVLNDCFLRNQQKLFEAPDSIMHDQRAIGSLKTEPSHHKSRGSMLKQAWKRDSDVNSCPRCFRFFGITFRRHHCRSCGGIFCRECTSLKAPVPHYGFKGDVRVCISCYDSLVLMKSVSQRISTTSRTFNVE